MRPPIPDPILTEPEPGDRYWYQRIRHSGEFFRYSPAGFSYHHGYFSPAVDYLFALTPELENASSPTEVDRLLAEALGDVQAAIWRQHRDEYGRAMEDIDMALLQCFMQDLIFSVGEAVLERIQDDEPTWREAWALLSALPTVVAPAHAEVIDQIHDEIEEIFGGQVAGSVPAWLGTPLQPQGTILQARDAYGGRFALFIPTVDPVTGREGLYLIDYDAAATGSIARAGDYPTLQAAEEAWKAGLNDSAATTAPTAVTDRDQIAYLDYIHDTTGLEPGQVGSVMREYWRAQRRICDTLSWLAVDGICLPPRSSRPFRPCEIGDDTAAFAVWLDHHGHDFTPGDIVRFLEEWCEFAPPGSQRCIAPARMRSRCAAGFGWDCHDETINQWLAMLPCWVRYCADRDHLPADLTAAALAVLPHTIEELGVPDHARITKNLPRSSLNLQKWA